VAVVPALSFHNQDPSFLSIQAAAAVVVVAAAAAVVVVAVVVIVVVIVVVVKSNWEKKRILEPDLEINAPGRGGGGYLVES